MNDENRCAQVSLMRSSGMLLIADACNNHMNTGSNMAVVHLNGRRQCTCKCGQESRATVIGILPSL